MDEECCARMEEEFDVARSNATLSANEEVVMHMIEDGNVNCLQQHLQAGGAGHFMGLGTCVYNSATPLRACLYGAMNQQGNATTMRAMLLLLEYGADINHQRGPGGGSVLSDAMFHDNMDIVEFAIANGANVNCFWGGSENCGPPDRTLLFSCETPQIADILLQNGANVNAREGLGWTPLHWIARRFRSPIARVPITRVLIDHGADLEAHTLTHGETPLHIAVKNGASKVARLLLESGANLEARTLSDNYTPLHVAVLHRHTNSVRLLLSYGASMTARDHVRRTAMDIADQVWLLGSQSTCDPLLEVLRSELDHRRRCEALARGVQSPRSRSLLYGVPDEVLRMVVQYGIAYSGEGGNERGGETERDSENSESDG